MRLLLAITALAYVAWLGYALLTLDAAAFPAAVGDPWVQVILGDFYLGILCIAVVVWCVEGPVPALLWGAATAVLGYPIAALWLILRGIPRLSRRAGP
jgi:hypothetical protein